MRINLGNVIRQNDSREVASFPLQAFYKAFEDVELRNHALSMHDVLKMDTPNPFLPRVSPASRFRYTSSLFDCLYPPRFGTLTHHPKAGS